MRKIETLVGDDISEKFSKAHRECIFYQEDVVFDFNEVRVLILYKGLKN